MKIGKIVLKKEKDITNEDRLDIKRVIENIIVYNIEEILEEKKINIDMIEKIGIAAPGTIENGCIKNAVNLGVEQFNIKEVIYKHFKNNITLRNDGKCAAIAEQKYGNIYGFSDAIYLCLGTGIGGAAFINNKLLEPKLNSGLEFGHMIIEKDGRICRCGKKGCFETYASMKNFKVNIRKILNLDEEILGGKLLEILELNKDKEEVKNVISDYIEYLAIGISNLINIFEPEVIVIGGSFVFYKNILLDKLIREIQNKGLLFNKRKDLNIKLAKLGNDAGIIGAVE